MSSKTITLALVGSGKWGQNYINTIKHLPNVILPEKYIKTKNYSDLFSKKSSIDGVIIATPTNTHFKIAADFIKNGFSNLLIEKPVTQTYEQALVLQEISEKFKALVTVGHIQIYNPDYQKLKKNLATIGEIRELSYQGLQSTPRSDSTVLEDWGPHPISLFMDIINSQPDKVFIRHLKKTANDNIRLVLKFKKIKAIADIGWTFPERKRRFEVRGTKGMLVLDWANNTEGSILNKSPLALQIMEFTHCIKTGKETKTPLSQGVAVMKIIKTAEQNHTLS
jgi:UDP-N-acetylglucosamine 3-dehydrogenase